MIIGSNEEITMLTIIIAPTLILVITLFLKTYGKRDGSKAGKSPPGDIGWPIVGSTFSFFKPHSPAVLGDFMHQQISKHGKIFTTRQLGKTTLISADLELNRFIAQNEMRLFDNNFPLHVRTLIGEVSLPWMPEDQYKRTKSVIVSFIKSWQIQTSFLEDVQKAADQVLNAWRHKDIIHVSQETHRFAFNMAAEKALGMDSDDPEIESLRKEFTTFRKGLSAVPINLPYTAYWKALNVAKKNMTKIIMKKVESKKMAENKNTKPKDFVDWLLENKAISSIESMEDICSSTIGFFLAAIVNLIGAMDTAVYLLGNCPKAVQQMQDEYRQIFREKNDDKAKLEWDDYKNLEFSHWVVNETLRLGNVSLFLFKKAVQDVEFKGYMIRGGTPILAYNAALNLDPSVFEEPESFDPWRWQRTKKTDGWMPFGGGLRFCCGAEIARMQILIFCQHLVQKYSWQQVEPDRPSSQPLVVFPKELPIRVQTLNTEESDIDRKNKY